MKKTLVLLLVFVILCGGGLPVLAQNKVSEMKIDAVVYEDGSMYITQVWDGQFDEGTENYIPMNAPDYLIISDLRVADQNGVYQVIEPWNIEASFAKKANKCGLRRTKEGYEICFGISEYGSNRYAIEYKLRNVLGGYSDRDGVNFRFVNSGMNTTPTDVRVEIRLADGTPFSTENSDIWAFGYEGQVVFEDGAIRAYTEKPISAKNHVTVMFSLDKGILKPTRLEKSSFETVKQEAFVGSDYERERGASAWGGILFPLIFPGIPIALILLIPRLKKRASRRELQEFTRKTEYFRDIPNSGNTNGTYTLGRLFNLCEDGAVLGTGILRLIRLDCLEPMSREEVGFMGRTREVISLRLLGSNHRKMSEDDKALYAVLEGAAGPDGILQAKELEKYAVKNDTLLREYITKCDEKGRRYLEGKDCFKKWKRPSALKYLTENGSKELKELVGFKQYLLDFSLIAERGVKEMPIWQDFLSYALLLGIAEKVAEQMKELYPEMAAEMAQYNQTVQTASSYHRLMYHNMRRSEERRAHARYSGGGGSSSLGGGGGSIGGGSGGGSR